MPVATPELSADERAVMDALRRLADRSGGIPIEDGVNARIAREAGRTEPTTMTVVKDFLRRKVIERDEQRKRLVLPRVPETPAETERPSQDEPGTGKTPPKRRAKPVGDSRPSAWTWDTNDGFGSARYWARAMNRCVHLNPAATNLGWCLRDVAETRVGEAFLGEAHALAEFGISPDALRRLRRELASTGWITDTRRKTSLGLKRWALTVPRCCTED